MIVRVQSQGMHSRTRPAPAIFRLREPSLRAPALGAVSQLVRLRIGAPATLTPVFELPDIFAAVLAVLTFAVFAALIWAGNHQH